MLIIHLVLFLQESKKHKKEKHKKGRRKSESSSGEAGCHRAAAAAEAAAAAVRSSSTQQQQQYAFLLQEFSELLLLPCLLFSPRCTHSLPVPVAEPAVTPASCFYACRLRGVQWPRGCLAAAARGRRQPRQPCSRRATLTASTAAGGLDDCAHGTLIRRTARQQAGEATGREGDQGLRQCWCSTLTVAVMGVGSGKFCPGLRCSLPASYCLPCFSHQSTGYCCPGIMQQLLKACVMTLGN